MGLELISHKIMGEVIGGGGGGGIGSKKYTRSSALLIILTQLLDKGSKLLSFFS